MEDQAQELGATRRLPRQYQAEVREASVDEAKDDYTHEERDRHQSVSWGFGDEHVQQAEDPRWMVDYVTEEPIDLVEEQKLELERTKNRLVDAERALVEELKPRLEDHKKELAEDERMRDMQTATNLKYYAIPDTEQRNNELQSNDPSHQQPSRTHSIDIVEQEIIYLYDHRHFPSIFPFEQCFSKEVCKYHAS